MALESFRHWQARSIDQKQAASALMLGLSGGALAYSASLLVEVQCYVGYMQSLIFHVHGATQLISLGAGVAFSLNRVRDFDMTASIARTREADPKDASLLGMCAKVRRWGRITRRLYLTQGISFVAGAIAFVFFVLLRFAEVLYPTPT